MFRLAAYLHEGEILNHLLMIEQKTLGIRVN